MVPGGSPSAYGSSFFLLMLLILPGNCNEGSKAGRCPCRNKFSSNSPPTAKQLEILRNKLDTYDQCFPYVRFHLRTRSQLRQNVCGGSQDPWVLDLISCYEKKECGYTHSQSQSLAAQEHLPPPNNPVPESTGKMPWNTSTPTQTAPSPTLQSTQQPTLPAATPSDKNFTHNNETTTSTVGPSLQEALEIREREKGNKGSAARESTLVAVPSLLVIVFLLLIILLYVKCKKRPMHNSPGITLGRAQGTICETWDQTGVCLVQESP